MCRRPPQRSWAHLRTSSDGLRRRLQCRDFFGSRRGERPQRVNDLRGHRADRRDLLSDSSGRRGDRVRGVRVPETAAATLRAPRELLAVAGGTSRRGQQSRRPPRRPRSSQKDRRRHGEESCRAGGRCADGYGDSVTGTAGGSDGSAGGSSVGCRFRRFLHELIRETLKTSLLAAAGDVSIQLTDGSSEIVEIRL